MYFYQILMRETMNFKMINFVLGAALAVSAGVNIYLYNEKKRLASAFENYIESTEERMNEYQNLIDTAADNHERITNRLDEVTKKLDEYIKEEEAVIEKSADVDADDPVEPTGGLEYVEEENE